MMKSTIMQDQAVTIIQTAAMFRTSESTEEKENRRIQKDGRKMSGAGAGIWKRIQYGVYGNQLYWETDVWRQGNNRECRQQQYRDCNAYNDSGKRRFGCL